MIIGREIRSGVLGVHWLKDFADLAVQ